MHQRVKRENSAGGKTRALKIYSTVKKKECKYFIFFAYSGGSLLIFVECPAVQAWKFGRNDCFVTAPFLSLIKDGNDNSFPHIQLHNTNTFSEDLTHKQFGL